MEGGKLAPKTFRGDPAEVERFLRRFERLAIQHNLTLEQRCEMVTDYCSRRVRETIEGFQAHASKDWPALHQKIRTTWNADLDSRRFRVCDLEEFIRDHRNEPISDIQEWRHYLRKYTRIAGWLRRHGKLTDREYAFHFWMGIHKRLRRRIDDRLRDKKPDHDMRNPWEPEDVEEAAERLLINERFDTESILYPREHLEDEPSRPRKTLRRSKKPKAKYEADTSDEDSDTEEEWEQYRQAPIVEAKATPSLTSPAVTPPTIPTTQLTKTPQDREVNELMEQMAKMSLTDPQYSFLYVRMMLLKPEVANHLPTPIKNYRAWYNQPAPRTLPPPMQPPTLPPPTLAQPVLPQVTMPPPQRYSNPRPPMSGCFGCGEGSHMMRECPHIQEFLTKGVIQRNGRGELVDPQGYLLRRFGGETWVQAIKRLNPDLNTTANPVVNYVTFSAALPGEDNSNGDTEDPEVYAATRTVPQTRAARKHSFENLRSPALDKGKQRDPPPHMMKTGPPSTRTTLPQLTPVEPQAPRFNPNNDNDMVIDWQQRAGTSKTPSTSQTSSGTAPLSAKDTTRPLPRQSQVSQQVSVEGITDRALDAPVTLSLKELLGVSKGVAAQMQNILKVKKVDFVTPPAPLQANLVTSAAQPLIKIRAEHEVKPFDCVVDSGSQLNIISEHVCRDILKQPIDFSKTVTMNDANGGTSQLLGMVKNIPINIGHIRTTMDAYVARDPPFEGLLGRPWAADNMVSIEERGDGTYLTFPPKGGQVQVDSQGQARKDELYVGPRPKDLNRNQSAWLAQTDHLILHSSLPQVYMASINESALEQVDILTDPPSGHETPSDKSETQADMEYLFPELELHPDILEEWEEKKTFRRIRCFLQWEQPGTLAERIGPSTIMAERTIEFPPMGAGMRTFLIRGGKLFSRRGGVFGHMVVRVMPYTNTTNILYQQMEDDTLEEHTDNEDQDTEDQELEEQEPPTVSTILTQNPEMVTSTTQSPEPPQRAPLAAIYAQIEDKRIPFLIDTGSEINCLHASIWQHLGGQPSQLHPAQFIGPTGDPLTCLGVWTTVIRFGNIVEPITFYVIKDLNLPGILGIIWQQYSRMRIENNSLGTIITMQSRSGRHTYEAILMRHRTPTQYRTDPPMTATITAEDGIPIIDFTDTDRLKTIMEGEPPSKPLQITLLNSREPSPESSTSSVSKLHSRQLYQRPRFSPPEEVIWSDEDEPEPSINPHQCEPEEDKLDIVISAPSSPLKFEPERQATELTLEREIYEELEFWFCTRLGRIPTSYQPDLSKIDVHQTIRLTGYPQLCVSYSEDQFLLKNVLVKVDDEYYEGHGLLHIAYFPHKTERTRQTEEEDRQRATQDSPIDLTNSPGYPHGSITAGLTEDDLTDFMMDIEELEKWDTLDRPSFGTQQTSVTLGTEGLIPASQISEAEATDGSESSNSWKTAPDSQPPMVAPITWFPSPSSWFPGQRPHRTHSTTSRTSASSTATNMSAGQWIAQPGPSNYPTYTWVPQYSNRPIVTEYPTSATAYHYPTQRNHYGWLHRNHGTPYSIQLSDGTIITVWPRR